MSASRQAVNFANAQHSTGPRTAEGKATVSQNANQHNLTGRLLIRDDERAAFAQLESQHRAQIQPQGALELTVFEQFIKAAWNLRRIETMEAEKFEFLADEAIARQLDRLARYRGQHERALYRALRELKDLQTAREMLERLPKPQKPNFLPLANLLTLKRVGFVLPKGPRTLIETYLHPPPAA